ncbi:unnamed protein product [Prunus brigantina]
MASLMSLPFATYLIFFFTLNLMPMPCFSCPQEHKEALLEFKTSLTENLLAANSTDEAMVTKLLESWNSSLDCCQWNLVTCHSDAASASKHITGLDISYLVLNGSVPSDVLAPLFRITTLMLLNIASNSMQGEIPGAGFANLTKLVYLDMRENRFNGYIPPQLFQLRYLEYLDLSGNFIQGTLNIPAEVGNLIELRKLSLRRNKLSGRIPLSVVSQLRELQVLDLQDNSLSMEIPAEIGNLVNISTLSLSNNNLSGGIPQSIQKMSKLETLALDKNILNGDIPAWLFELKELKNLHLGGNKLRWNNTNVTITPKCMLSQLSLRSCDVGGPIPIWLSNQTRLDLLDLSENRLEGAFPLWLAKLQVGILFLSDNKLTGSLPPPLFQTRSLQVLELSRNNFSGKLPEDMGENCAVMILMLSENNFSGPVPKSIANIYRLLLLDLSRNNFLGELPIFKPDALLAFVDISSNKLSGKVPATFGLNTTMLSLGQNEFSGQLPKNLSNLSQLEHLDLHDNNITGDFPTFLTQISSLQVLNLRNNSIRGSISGDLSNHSSLRILDLSNNLLRGNIPLSVGNLIAMIETPDIPTNLPDAIFSFLVEYDLIVNWKKSKQGLSSHNLDIYSLLDLSKNQFSGNIPSSLGRLKGLKLLNISSNELSGSIPLAFGDLESLETLDLSHNNLSGQIPQTFAKLQELNTLDLSNNKLVGHIPESPQMDTLIDPNIYANNSGLCGVQIQLRCPEEHPPSTKTDESDEKNDTWWFSWATAGIGFPFGFFSVVVSMYVVGYFSTVATRTRRGSQCVWQR